MKRKIIAASMITALAVSSVMPAYAEPTVLESTTNRVEEKIPILINGLEIDSDQPPIIIEGRTLVPLRVIFEALGATVNWNNDTRSVIATRGDTSLYLAIGSNTLYKNGQPVYLDVPGQIINDRTMVPLRAVSESFGANVVWDNDTRTVYVDTNIESTPEEPDVDEPAEPEYPNPPIETPEEPDNPPVEPDYPEVNPPEEQPPVVDDQAAAYDSAIDLYKNGYSYQAYYAFKDLGNYRDSVEMMKKARLLNRISYNYNDRTSKWFVEHVNDFVPVDESEISSIMTQGSWIFPGSQYLGYATDTFLENGTRLHNGLPTMEWHVAFGGIYASKYDPNTSYYTEYSLILQKDFRKLMDDVYANIAIKVSEPIKSGAYADIYIKKGSTFGNAYESCIQRLLFNTSNDVGVIQDENGLCYLAVITGTQIGEKLPS